MRRFWGFVSLGVVLVGPAFGCGDGDSPQGDDQTGVESTAFSRLGHRQRRVFFDPTAGADCWPTPPRSVVCGNDGKTYVNECQAGGASRIAHIGACADFVCNGVVCAAGFTCRTFSNYGVVTDQCVSDTGIAPSCTCASGSHCVQAPSGAVSCQGDPPAPPPPPNPTTLCQGMTCPAGMHCAIITVYGVPATTCNRD